MRKFISEYNNGRYKAGCTGGTVIVIDMETNEVIDKIKVPYCYCGTFVGDRDIFIAKSTAGYLLKYDIKAKEATRIRPSTITQDGGFAVNPWNDHLYNIEMTSRGFQIAIYDVESFKDDMIIPVEVDATNVYDVEFDKEDHLAWYISLSYSLNGYVKRAIIKMRNHETVDIKDINTEEFHHLVAYKYWQRCGFTDKSKIVAEMFSTKYQIPITLSELYNKQ